MSAFATASDMAARHDINVIGDLCTDDRARLSRMDILRHPNIATALLDASGEILVALQQGGNYSAEDLANLTAGGPEEAHLKRVTCWIAMALLFERRPGVHIEEADKYLERAAEYKRSIADGQNVFGVPDNRLASGVPSVSGLDAGGYDQLNLLPERMGRYFPGSVTRIPKQRGGTG